MCKTRKVSVPTLNLPDPVSPPPSPVKPADAPVVANPRLTVNGQVRGRKLLRVRQPGATATEA